MRRDITRGMGGDVDIAARIEVAFDGQATKPAEPDETFEEPSAGTANRLQGEFETPQVFTSPEARIPIDFDSRLGVEGFYHSEESLFPGASIYGSEPIFANQPVFAQQSVFETEIPFMPPHGVLNIVPDETGRLVPGENPSGYQPEFAQTTPAFEVIAQDPRLETRPLTIDDLEISPRNRPTISAQALWERVTASFQGWMSRRR
jgi:hypothetical protein